MTPECARYIQALETDTDAEYVREYEMSHPAGEGYDSAVREGHDPQFSKVTTRRPVSGGLCSGKK